ncbi:MAG: hypothetical protein ACK5L6_10565 [Anaerorhabdus sp.]|uniref:hypothetical protein n=1 Tax=Anaerorhabdus sp. TaxID=1872524 RepID=UPI003A8956C5
MEQLNGNYKVFNDLSKIERRSTVVLIISLVSMFCCALFCIYMIFRTNESARNRFYLLENGQKIAAVRIEDPERALEILCEGHIANFHELFFSLEPDLRLIKRNIEGNALYMVDHSGKRLYNRLVDQNYYEDVAKSDYSIELEQDSITIDFARYPFRFRFMGKQKITRDGKSEYRSLVTTGYVTESQTTPNNLNGLKIIHFKVDNNNDL